MTAEKQHIIDQLKRQILEIQGFKPAIPGMAAFGLGYMERCFPNAVFPTGTIHEFMAEGAEDAAASIGFIAGLLSIMMEKGNVCLWISRNRKLFPPALNTFGVLPEQVVFIDVAYAKEILWVMEEALKCDGLAAVIAEIGDVDFSQSRRLQLAVEKSRVTGLLLRKQPKRSSATACTARWRVKPLPSKRTALPGVGNPCWEVTLEKVRNGQTGVFSVEWKENHFSELNTAAPVFMATQKAG